MKLMMVAALAATAACVSNANDVSDTSDEVTSDVTSSLSPTPACLTGWTCDEVNWFHTQNGCRTSFACQDTPDSCVLDCMPF
jgi:hypothetical protein